LRYLECAKHLLGEYRDDWNRGVLRDPFELTQFCQLIDGLILYARQPSSLGYPPESRPEKFLCDLLSKQIRATTFFFLKSYPRASQLENSDCWNGYAMMITRNEILSDAAKRPEVDVAVSGYLKDFESSPEKHLALVNRRIKADRDSVLGLRRGRKPEDIPSEEAGLVNSDPEDLWDGVPDGENVSSNRFRILLRDSAAIRVAEKNARRKGIGYEPYRFTPEDQELINKLNGLYYVLLGWSEQASHHTLKERVAFVENMYLNAPLLCSDWVMKVAEIQRFETVAGITIPILCSRLRNLSPRHSFIAYLFGKHSSGTRGRLYRRLRDLYELMERQQSRHQKSLKAERYSDDPSEKDEEREPIKRGQIRHHAQESEASSPEKSLMWASFINSLPGKRTQEVARLYLSGRLKQSEIARKLGTSRQAVNKHIKRITNYGKSHPEELPS
jgi:DNA-directed RNA polymerase specialized sigma24 family protein